MVTRLYERHFRGSYFHQPQPIGKCIESGRIAGYLNDLTGKADFEGPTNQAGVPLRRHAGGELVELPVSAAQMALGLYDRWLLQANEGGRERFLGLAQYLVGSRTEWSPGIVWTYDFDVPIYGLKGPFISAMGRGEVISVLVRAHHLTHEREFLDVAIEASRPMSIAVEDGGVGIETELGWWLEEYPTSPPSFVLNGCLFALWGLYDLGLAGHEPARLLYASVVETVVRHFEKFDVASWSRYDLYPFAGPHLASPFYHRLHVAQLEAMTRLSDDQSFRHYRDRWHRSAGSELKASLAIAHKTAFRATKAAQRRLSGRMT